MMRVLIVHNRYQQRGGEDSVVESEAQLLNSHGVRVELLRTDNDHIRGMLSKIKASAEVGYSRKGVARVEAAIVALRPDVVHVHNWFPSLSPAIFWTCNRMRVPIVHTLHNYRLLCVKASLYRDGKPCEKCVGKTLRLPGIAYGCYRGSRAGSAAATAAMLFHWQIGTWQRHVDRFIALSHFAKMKLVEGGLPESKIVVKPNALSFDPGIRGGGGGYFVYVGRLTDEKGIPTLLECWQRDPMLPTLYVVGAGPLDGKVRAAASLRANIQPLGLRDNSEVVDIMGQARAVICPSLWYEGMPRVAIEAMAVGTPVIASRLGTYVEMMQDSHLGLLFEAGKPDALLKCVRRAVSGCASVAMRREARMQFEAKYSPEVSFRQLQQIYRDVSLASKRIEMGYQQTSVA